MHLNENSYPEQEEMDESNINLALELLFGGQETVTCAMTCTLLLLGNHPEVVTEIRREIGRNFPLASSFANKHCYENLEVVGNVFKEIIRLYPPIGGGFRKAKTAFEVNVGRKDASEYRLKQASSFFNRWSLHCYLLHLVLEF